jgi:hypothetical protein
LYFCNVYIGQTKTPAVACRGLAEVQSFKD